MKIIYKKGKKITPKQILDLYISVKWAKSSKKEKGGKSILEMYKNASQVTSAWEGKKLVGIVRILTDKVMDGVIFGVVVHKDYQGKGIGKRLLKECVKPFTKVKVWYVGCEKESVKFYKKAGFKIDNDYWLKKK